jgi:hypothetical protein
MITRWSPRFSAARAAVFITVFTVACGGSQPVAPASRPAGPAAAPAAGTAAPAAAPGIVSIIEPGEGSSSGHIDLFRWSPVEGATGYKMHLVAATDGRTIWDSPVLTTTEAHLPNTIALEPEAHVWTVTALKGESVIAESGVHRFLVTP